MRKFIRIYTSIQIVESNINIKKVKDISGLGVPYTFPNKADSGFKHEKSNSSHYKDLSRVLDLLELFESDLYGGSLIPVIIILLH